MATHSIFLAWKIPWTEEPGRLPFMGSQRVRHDSDGAHMKPKCRPPLGKEDHADCWEGGHGRRDCPKLNIRGGQEPRSRWQWGTNWLTLTDTTLLCKLKARVTFPQNSPTRAFLISCLWGLWLHLGELQLHLGGFGPNLGCSPYEGK